MLNIIGVLIVKVATPPNIVKQHLLETFFHLEVGEMIVDETPTQEWEFDVTITRWIVIEEK